MLELQSSVIDKNLNFLFLAEHWLSEAELEAVQLGDFRLISFYCRARRIHGGVCAFSGVGQSVQVINLEGLCEDLHCEVSGFVWGDICFVVVYRSPSGDFNIFLNNIEKVLLRCMGHGIIVVGDFNVHFNTRDGRSLEVTNLFASFGLIQNNFQNTRDDSCLDNVFSNLGDPKVEVVNYGLSDHFGLLVHIKTKEKLTNTQSTMKFTPITQHGLSLLQECLRLVDWSFVGNDNLGTEARFRIFNNIITSNVGKCFKEIKLISSGNIKGKGIAWFNSELKEHRERLHLLSDLHSKKLISGVTLKEFKKFYKTKLKMAKKAANDKYIEGSSNSSAAAWKLINAHRISADDSSQMPSHEILNQYFSNIARSISDGLPYTNADPIDYIGDSTWREEHVGFQFRTVTYNEVRDVTLKLKNSNSKDVYNLNSKILKAIIDVILIPFTDILNSCITHGVFPDILKTARVIPIYKKGNKQDPGNYRPISILPIIGKVFEKLLKVQINSFFEINGIFHASQFGFRNNRSTTMAISSLCKRATQAFESNEYLHAHFYDLSKAFDCVSHGILLEKLAAYGLHSNAIMLIKSYLGSRSQCVSFNNINSSYKMITTGVPQGSVLGPILFLIFINDLPRCTSAHSVLFADDTTTFNTGTNLTDLALLATQNRDELRQWFLANKLCLNEGKSQSLVFTLKQIVPGGDPVEFLGVRMDSKLTWAPHINKLACKLSKHIYAMRQLKNLVSFKVLKTAYFGLIHSNLSYAILAWGHSTHASKIFALQRKIIRIICGLGFRDDCKNKFIELNILTMPCLYVFQALLFVKDNEVSYQTGSHSYNTRQKGNIVPAFHRLSRSREAMGYHGIKFYNVLPERIRSLPPVQFRKAVSRFLLQQAFYSVDEYNNYKFSEL